ncbi:hypothetical protein FHT98_0288 [Bosea sp. AK1]|uniref:hypothetical protein n=1 Tax=Bosea sp. AK1 TaxID=2587160 RepID=UPI000DE2A68A|nr:hypothetical protein [Bosea sp. AK1]TQI72578.1 hypothetical protein FHT98_0288 [Bosea sp. AK1]
MRLQLRIGGAGLLAAMVILGSAAAFAQQSGSTGTDWPTEKCNRYRKAYDQSLARLGKKGLGAEFLASHDAFLASNCQARAEVCARSKEELELANRLVVMAMNSGMSSTFLPFNCRN